LACEDSSARLEEGPEVLVGHDTLALHILRRINHALELLDEKLLQQLSVRLRGALVFGVIVQLGDGLLEFRPTVDERLEPAGELKAVQTNSDTGIVLQDGCQKRLQ
jgi:hypothetical protein